MRTVNTFVAIGIFASSWVSLSATAQAQGTSEPVAEVSSPPWWKQGLDNKFYKLYFNFRARMELADLDEAEGSQAFTFRSRFGIGSKPLYGFSGFAEGEGTFSAGNLFFDAVSEPNGRTVVADPDNIELNQLWAQFEKKEWAGVKARVGRQRIVLDDSRFIGNVVWRQNEQTYDAALGQTSLGIKGLKITYAYLLNVIRIFGDQGPDNRRDFDSDSHIVNAQYKLPLGITLTAFTYLLDFDNSPGNSSNTFGGRVVGKHKLSPITLGYIGSYAYQMDAGDNPTDYEANYVNLEGSVGIPYVTLKAGYELLGSDDGNARFVTPLSTAHKFNGFADVFLNNGGGNGLQDLYATVSPKLPFNMKGFATYHRFMADNGGNTLGNEFDFVVKRAFGKHFGVLTKGAFFFTDTSTLQDIWRFNLDLNFNY